MGIYTVLLLIGMEKYRPKIILNTIIQVLKYLVMIDNISSTKINVRIKNKRRLGIQYDQQYIFNYN